MIQINTNLKSTKFTNTNEIKTTFEQNTYSNDLLFSENNQSPIGDEVLISKKTIPPSAYNSPQNSNDTISTKKISPFPEADYTNPERRITPVKKNSITNPAKPETDTLRIFKDPKDMVVIEFYLNGKPHYVRNFYNDTITKEREYAGDGSIIAIDEYIDGVLRKHTDNYPGSEDIWSIEEYNEKGKLLRYYEYAPFGRLIDYKAFPVE